MPCERPWDTVSTVNRVARLLAVMMVAFAPLAVAFPATAAGVPSLRSDVNDFSFESFSADYYLDVDAAGRSTLTTVETFVALFPEYDQNRGMRRAIPGSYFDPVTGQDAPTDVQVQSVTDETGAARPYTVETDDAGFVLVTSAADTYVHGRQTYVITYTQHNVTRFFADTNDDEFYWDTNGTGWAQSFGSVTARVHVASTIEGALTGQASCYEGALGSTTPCDLAVSQLSDGTLFETTVTDVGPGENVTVAIGFEPHTFVARDDSYFGSPLGWLQVLAVGGSVFALVLAIVFRFTTLADGRGRPTIIAEYTPPAGTTVLTSSVILGRTRKAMAATLVDWAVRGRVRIIEQPAQGWFASGTDYLVELVDPTGIADGPERTLATALFGWHLTPGTGYLLTKRDTVLGQYVRSIIQIATSQATRDGLRAPSRGFFGAIPIVLAVLSAVATFILGVSMADQSLGGLVPIALFAPVIVITFVVFVLAVRVPLTSEGAQLRDHLKGLDLYIRLAEADRLRMLQSPSTAEREAVSVDDPRQVVDIYEKLLPYAILFGHEREWAAELGRYYSEASPDWYQGTSAFNAAVFASSIGSMSTSVSTSYSGSSSSSSSGGSGGGGSSGGGGGGGGGGGV